ncbi:MAG: GntR family transcriptional regulator [Betaproteobacteria bacterium]|nr:MAG: GntR family transcriptional regulator [Betaproteobacteria bacterium]
MESDLALKADASTPPRVALTRIESTPDLVDRVYRALIDAISVGTLAPGARITQEEIAEQLAVSRQPVLQALRQLKSHGFLIDAPGRGLLVAPLDAVWLGQVYEVRTALDALAARLAAEANAASRSIAASVFRHDEALMARGRSATRRDNVTQLIDCDLEFHNAIYAAARNPLIEQSARLHWQHIRRAMGAVLQPNEHRKDVWDQHEAISLAIAAGDDVQAAALMNVHGSSARQFVIGQLADRVVERGAKSASVNASLVG